jgi:protein-S-isoprenylcysteine O-methyltransferase Ste14
MGLRKIFGVGPFGAALTLLLLGLVLWAERKLGRVPILESTLLLRCIAAVLFVLGAGVHVWSMLTLRSWWQHDRLCTDGPFKYVRHPMYSGWVLLVGLGIALFMNSWPAPMAVILVLPFWHLLVRKEERTMEQHFGSEYRSYRRNTPRFIPQIFHR